MYCTNCGNEIEDNAVFCPHCRYFVQGSSSVSARPRSFDIEQSSLSRALLPVGRSGYSIAAGYIALFSILIWPLGVVAVIFAFIAMRDIRAHPEKCGMGRVGFAFALGGLTSVITLVILAGLLYSLLRG